jgi:hypothetical protein
LDIPKVQHVIHYDVARSPQLYIHRSGRTARAGAAGTAVSLVAPEDALHHAAICQALLKAGDKRIIKGAAAPAPAPAAAAKPAAATGAGAATAAQTAKAAKAAANKAKAEMVAALDRNPKLPLLSVDLSLLPALRERVGLAKKIFTQSFVVSKRTKEQSWLRQSANEADLDLDDFAEEVRRYRPPRRGVFVVVF